MKKNIYSMIAAMSAVLMFSGIAFADTVSVNFENPPYTIGNINGQNGWSNTGTYDANVIASSVANFGSQSLQISDAKTSGSFGDQIFSPSLTNEAGEAVAENGGMSGGVRQSHFEAQFDLASIMPTQQAGMHMSVSPDRGDGARMSYLRFEDQADGIHVFFDDVTDPSGVANADTFNESDIAILSRAPHTIKFIMDFVAGAHNDVVKIYIDGVLVHTGTSWEDYYRFDTESNPSAPSDTSRTVDSLLFRESGTANIADTGNGFLIDNLTLTSGSTPSGSVVVVTPSNTQGWSTADTRPGGAVNFVTDGTTPAGIGALQLTTDNTTTSKAQYLHDAGSVPLTSVTELSYYTKQNSASFSGGDASYQLPVFLTGAGTGFTTFVFEPYENGTVTPGVWQQWDVAKGQFWSSRTVVCENGTITAGGGGAPFYTLSQIESMCPSAVVAGFGVNIGSNNPSYDVETDLVSFNNTAYNFEPDPKMVKIQIFKYVDGVLATAASTSNAVFPMLTTFNSPNLGNVTDVPFTLSPSPWGGIGIPYEADFIGSVAGADYAAHEVTTANNTVGASCADGKPFALNGYTTGDTLTQAQAATLSMTVPQFTNLQSDHVMIVWNMTCPIIPPTPTDKNQCMNNGWKTLSDGSHTFKNQGDCVSFVATKGKNKAAGN